MDSKVEEVLKENNNSLPKDLKAKDCSCPSCGGAMKYVPEKEGLFCDNCKTLKPIKKVKEFLKNNWEDRESHLENDWNNLTKNLKCPNCGASVVLSGLEYSSICPYCDSSLVSTQGADEIAPDAIIPFTFSDADASKKYVAGIKKKWFLPNKFKKAPPVENIKGVYIPSFGFDADTFSEYSGVLEIDKSYTNINGERVTRVETKRISGTHNSAQRDVMVESSSKIVQDQLEQIESFNMAGACKFDQGFIMGYTVEKYETKIESCKVVADAIMKLNVKNEILSKYRYDRVRSFNLTLEQSNNKYLYYLLPIYECKYKYKNKDYITLMNGQTGKVGGGYPKSGVKITFFTLFIIAIVVGIIALVMFLK